MLKTLSIRNYAIIEELEIDFSDQMNVMTGETGAGKSIIIGALALILGERADSSVLVNKDKKSVIEGLFSDTDTPAIRRLFAHFGWDAGDDIIIRREISSQGKSRAFVNDSPVTLAQLQQLARLLVDLHRQFDTLVIGEHEFQRDVLDAMAGQTELVQEYQSGYQQWQQTVKEWKDLQQQKAAFDAEADYNRFQLEELSSAAFKENELEELDAGMKLMSHAEGIRTALERASDTLDNGEAPVIAQLKSLIQVLQPYESYHTDLAEVLTRLQATYVELQDLSGDMERILRQVHVDPEEMERMNERLSLGYRLQKKHGVNDTSGLLQIQQRLEEKMQAVFSIDDQIAGAEKKASDREKQLRAQAARISEARKKQAGPLETKVNKLLAQVGMPNARLKVEIVSGELRADGSDRIEFLFDANKSGQFSPVGKVASGGELSRLMLCIKSLVATKMDLPTLIFDEIDTGISGEAARQVGIIMKELAGSRQILCITHQPQIAGKGDAHYFVYKDNQGKKVNTHIRRLEEKERITHIAQMLSGEKPTAAALENAREMVTR